MIENLDIGDMVVFKDGDEAVIDQVVQRCDGEVAYTHYHLNAGFWMRYTPSCPEANKDLEDQIAKVIKHGDSEQR